jgi:adenylate kinase
MVQLSTGDMLRAAIASGSELGQKVKGVLDRGELVTDEIVIALIEERLPEAEAAGGAIFDGFPRTVAQAQALDSMLAKRGQKIDSVLRLKVDEPALIERITKRFAEQGRSDDNPEVFVNRLASIQRQTAPLLPYYREQGKLTELDGMGPWMRSPALSTPRFPSWLKTSLEFARRADSAIDGRATIPITGRFRERRDLCAPDWVVRPGRARRSRL